MRRMARILRLIALFACPALLCGALSLAAEGEPAADDESTVVEKLLDEGEAAPVEPQPELSPEMAAMRDGVRRALAMIAKQPFNTRDNTPDNVMELSLAFGAASNVRYGGPSQKSINAIGCLAWNYPCAGYRLLSTGEGRVMARLGYALQTRPAQFLAVLAQSGVPVDYEVQAGEFRGTVADLVEFEKRNVRGGADLSFALIGLMRYLKDDPNWENDLQEEWSIERLIREELARSPNRGESDVTDRLMGLSYAVDRRAKRELPLEGEFLTAQRHLAQYQDFTLGLQNPDGTWHPDFFAHRGTSRDTEGLLRSTGHILEWLVFSLPDDRLEDPRVVRSVTYLAKRLGNQRTRWNVTSKTPSDFRGLMHATHALRIYDRRVFQPLDPKEPDAEEEEEAAETLAYRSTPE
ncbi:hypothetical protein ACFL5Q_05790 [Planctomycetota bacterium]